MPELVLTLLRGIAPDTALLGTDDLDALIADAEAGPEHRAPSDAECLIRFTSGTSGRAKGVRLTHRNIGKCGAEHALRHRVHPADRRAPVRDSLENPRGLVPPVSALLIRTAGGALLGDFPDTAGPKSPPMQVRVTDAGGASVPARTVGELELRGGLVMAGYVGAEPQHGWLATGDLGYLDEHGLAYLVDRSKDIVISAGENISCTEVEAALMAGGAFPEVAAFGVPDDRRGERVVVAATLEPGHELDAEQVRELARRTLPEYKVQSEVLFDQSPLPRNATGKLLERELRRRYAAR